MSFTVSEGLPWHEGEEKMHKITKVPQNDNPMSPFLTPRAANQIQRFPLMALGTLDDQDRPWCTIWGGETPFAQPVARSIIGIRTVVDKKFDPVVQEIFQGKDDGEVIKEKEKGRMISGLSIHLEERNRVKLFGRMVVGALSAMGEEKSDVGQVQLVVKIEQSLANCPKYLNSKRIRPSVPEPKLTHEGVKLGPEGINLLAKADMFFISSMHLHEDMDLNHRGGPPGFMRVESNEEDGTVLVWPEYSGNNLYQTLGNLQTDPKAGLVIPDFETGDVLYLTGQTEVFVGKDANEVLPHSSLAVRFKVTGGRFIENGLPFRGEPTERSPYNPRVRYLKSEKEDALNGTEDNKIMAKLIKKDKLTPTIFRYRFAISDPVAAGTWKPGQYVAFSFYDELYMGYSHMRDDDPQSINDDLLRTFTISSHHGEGLHGEEFEITVRKVGRVTDHMSGLNKRSDFEVPLKGFGGDFKIEQKSKGITPFVAGGVGITPLLGQLPDLEMERLHLFWTASVKDVGLIQDTFERNPSLAKSTSLFLTGDATSLPEGDQKNLEKIRNSGAQCEMRRIQPNDLLAFSKNGDEWYLCTAPALRKQIQEWLPGKKLVYENFDY
jgi:NAD(P)H-flavin reductase